MLTKLFRRLLALSVVTAMFLSACGAKNDEERDGNGDALTWGTWSGYGKYEAFLGLLGETYPEIELEFISYTGGNATGYSWAQMRADDIPDIFITSQMLDEGLAKERLVDLSGYDFVNQLSTSLLDQVSVDGGVYLLPINNIIYGIYYNKTLMEEHGCHAAKTVPATAILHFFSGFKVAHHTFRRQSLCKGFFSNFQMFTVGFQIVPHARAD